MPGPVSESFSRVRYAETDQMGFAHHSTFLLWCEEGRTEYMRQLGMAYPDLEARGIWLPVADVRLRFRASARYDEQVTIRSWVRHCGSRLVEFGNAILRTEGNVLLATAAIKLMAVTPEGSPARLPEDVRNLLVPADDPIRL